MDGSYYKGYTLNYFERLQQHNDGLSHYTIRKRPWVLVYLEKFESKKEALIREKVLKKYSHDQIFNLINSPKNRCKSLVDAWLEINPQRVGD